MTQYVGLDVSLKETKLHVLDEAGNRIWRGRCATDSAAIAAAVRRYAPTAVRIGLETGPLTTWLWLLQVQWPYRAPDGGFNNCAVRSWVTHFLPSTGKH
jgi:hypothetical protein